MENGFVDMEAVKEELIAGYRANLPKPDTTSRWRYDDNGDLYKSEDCDADSGSNLA
jgi:hypothetical protein